ncbi:MAG: histidinol dehydrogenase [Bacteroidetes bacterium]|nr:histidinol dehydrogenase [Bacteroidota bacterium]
MQKIINPQRIIWQKLTTRPNFNCKQLDNTVNKVFNAIKENGDEALRQYSLLYDKAVIKDFRINNKKLIQSGKKISNELKDAINLAKNNIEKFHLSQKSRKKIIETTNGVKCWQESRPIEKVGLYIPGGFAPLFSTVLMLGVPAVIAGCKDIALCTPPNKNGDIHPAILYIANLIGIKNIFKVGGIQAIAAMTFGTETVPKVYKIFGPGNRFVTAAKQTASMLGVAIDMPAGPSELLMLTDKSADPSFVAADLLSQAEHGKDSQIICIVNNLKLMGVIENEVEKQLNELPRKDVAETSIQNSKLIYFDEKKDIIDFINEYAPEHFILSVQKESEKFYLQNLKNAGSVFIGNYTPESAGDYASGTNHTLPTNGFAKTYSGINLDSFIKKISFQRISKEGITNIGPAVETMAEAEGLQAHKNSVTIRLKSIKDEKD